MSLHPAPWMGERGQARGVRFYPEIHAGVHAKVRALWTAGFLGKDKRDLL